MPNWCNNSFELIGEKEQIDAFENFLNGGNGKDWFNFFSATPEELTDTTSPNRDAKSAEALREKYGASDWYEWNLSNWGCKWNCDANDWCRNGPNSISFWFDSPWGPPVRLYERISEGEFGEGLDVIASYHEEGMAFVGEFFDGFDSCYEYSDLESLDEIPDSLINEWNLREMLEERAEWEEQEALEEEMLEEDESEEASEEDMIEALDELKKEFDVMMKNEKESKK